MCGFDPNSVLESAKIAENEPTRFLAGERATYLRDMVRQVEQYQNERKTVEQIKTLMPQFLKAYPRLFDMVTAPNYDKSQLRTQLTMLDKMGTGELSQHQASVIVGQKVVNTYVMPKLKGSKPH